MRKTAATDTGKSLPAKDGFPEPNSTWLREQFSKTRIGAMKASELELYLAYQLMWEAGDLAKSPYDIARKYGYTESKATRLLQEFSYRFREKEEDSAFLDRLWRSITGKDMGKSDGAVVPIVQDTDILLSIQSPYDRDRLRNIVENEGFPWLGDFNKKLVRMPVLTFAYIFRAQSPGFDKVVERARKALQSEMKGRNLTPFAIFSHLKKHGPTYLSFAKEVLGVILPYLN